MPKKPAQNATPVCGTSDLKKGQRHGSMPECAMMGQVRYWGIKRVDNKLLESVKASRKVKPNRLKLMLAITSARSKAKKLEKEVALEKDKKKKKQKQEEIKGFWAEAIRLGKQLRAFEAAHPRTLSRSKSRKSHKSKSRRTRKSI